MSLLNKLLLFSVLLTISFTLDIFAQMFQRPLRSIQQKLQSAKNIQYLFQTWKLKYNKYYSNEKEEYYRLKIFTQNWKLVQKHSLQKDDNYLTYDLELNKFGDQTKQEYIILLESNIVKSQKKLPGLTFSCTGTITTAPNPPDEVDWSIKAVTPVSNQGQCGSSWAITAKGAVQGLFALKAGPLTQFSTQQLLDCSGDYGNEGCFGGFMTQAFWYIIDNGIATSKAYPDKNTTTPQKCVYTKSMKVASFTRCADVPSESYIKLQSAVIQQPTAVAIDASELQLYKTGVYNGKCGNNINQGMLLVGYGFDQASNSTYWKLKNSLGTSWGIDGYLKLYMDGLDGPGKCGIQIAASVPQSLT